MESSCGSHLFSLENKIVELVASDTSVKDTFSDHLVKFRLFLLTFLLTVLVPLLCGFYCVRFWRRKVKTQRQKSRSNCCRRSGGAEVPLHQCCKHCCCTELPVYNEPVSEIVPAPVPVSASEVPRHQCCKHCRCIGLPVVVPGTAPEVLMHCECTALPITIPQKSESQLRIGGCRRNKYSTPPRSIRSPGKPRKSYCMTRFKGCFAYCRKMCCSRKRDDENLCNYGYVKRKICKKILVLVPFILLYAFGLYIAIFHIAAAGSHGDDKDKHGNSRSRQATKDTHEVLVQNYGYFAKEFHTSADKLFEHKLIELNKNFTAHQIQYNDLLLIKLSKAYTLIPSIEKNVTGLFAANAQLQDYMRSFYRNGTKLLKENEIGRGFLTNTNFRFINKKAIRWQSLIKVMSTMRALQQLLKDIIKRYNNLFQVPMDAHSSAKEIFDQASQDIKEYLTFQGKHIHALSRDLNTIIRRRSLTDSKSVQRNKGLRTLACFLASVILLALISIMLLARSKKVRLISIAKKMLYTILLVIVVVYPILGAIALMHFLQGSGCLNIKCKDMRRIRAHQDMNLWRSTQFGAKLFADCDFEMRTGYSEPHNNVVLPKEAFFSRLFTNFKDKSSPSMLSSIENNDKQYLLDTAEQISADFKNGQLCNNIQNELKAIRITAQGIHAALGAFVKSQLASKMASTTCNLNYMDGQIFKNLITLRMVQTTDNITVKCKSLNGLLSGNLRDEVDTHLNLVNRRYQLYNDTYLGIFKSLSNQLEEIYSSNFSSYARAGSDYLKRKIGLCEMIPRKDPKKSCSCASHIPFAFWMGILLILLSLVPILIILFRLAVLVAAWEVLNCFLPCVTHYITPTHGDRHIEASGVCSCGPGLIEPDPEPEPRCGCFYTNISDVKVIEVEPSNQLGGEPKVTTAEQKEEHNMEPKEQSKEKNETVKNSKHTPVVKNPEPTVIFQAVMTHSSHQSAPATKTPPTNDFTALKTAANAQPSGTRLETSFVKFLPYTDFTAPTTAIHAEPSEKPAPSAKSATPTTTTHDPQLLVKTTPNTNFTTPTSHASPSLVKAPTNTSARAPQTKTKSLVRNQSNGNSETATSPTTTNAIHPPGNSYPSSISPPALPRPSLCQSQSDECARMLDRRRALHQSLVTILTRARSADCICSSNRLDPALLTMTPSKGGLSIPINDHQCRCEDVCICGCGCHDLDKTNKKSH